MTKNVVCWADIAVVNLDRAIKFYATVMNVKVEKIESPFGAFGIFPHEDCSVGACLSNERKPSKEGALVYLDCTGFIDEAVARVEEAGGKVLAPKMLIGEYGYRAIIEDSEGGVVALYAAPDGKCCE